MTDPSYAILLNEEFYKYPLIIGEFQQRVVGLVRFVVARIRSRFHKFVRDNQFAIQMIMDPFEEVLSPVPVLWESYGEFQLWKEYALMEYEMRIQDMRAIQRDLCNLHFSEAAYLPVEQPEGSGTEKSEKVTDEVATSKKHTTLLDLFRMNEDRLKSFLKLLKNPTVRALDEDHYWIYSRRKSSIVACFKALEDLGLIRKNLPRAVLQRTVAQYIHFKGNEKLFRNGFNPDDYQTFSCLFQKRL